MVDCQVHPSQLCKIILTQDIYVQTSAVNSIRGWLVRMSKNLWVPDRCWPRICTSIAPISLRRSSENYISPSGKYLTLRGNFISTYLLHYEKHVVYESGPAKGFIPEYQYTNSPKLQAIRLSEYLILGKCTEYFTPCIFQHI